MRLFLAFAASLSLIACSVAEIPGDGSATNAAAATTANAASTATTDAQEVTCPAGETKVTPGPIDPNSLTACACAAGGKARCAPKSKLPSSLINHLDSCDDGTGAGAGACVPDTVISSGGAPLTQCKASGGGGRCLSLCVPEVSQNQQYLTRGDSNECADDERCIPCLDPLSGEATGICDVETALHGDEQCIATGTAPAGSGVAATPGETLTCPFSGTPGNPDLFPQCDTGGRCLENSLVPSDLASRLDTCDAGSGKAGLCVPEVYVTEKGKHLPTKCSSFAGIEGRCFSTVFKDVAAQKDFLKQDDCQADERCLPCFNPADGAPTGVCTTVSCDKSTTQPPALKDCCNSHGQDRGKCIPKTDVPASVQDRLSKHECDNTQLCVPSDNINTDLQPVACDAGGGAGVCVSDCVELGFFEGLFIDRGSCREDQNCIPCESGGQPTGAPGCPNN